MHDNLAVLLIYPIAVIAVIAYVFSQTQAFLTLFKDAPTLQDQIVLIALFSCISIAGTYFGVPVEGAIANVRDTGSIVAGLVGGPFVGITTGIISGLHRMSLGGFTAVECGIATMLGGALAGWIHWRMQPKMPECITGIVTGSGVILGSMGLVLLFAKPFIAAWSLVSVVAIPMVVANGLGIAVFMIIIYNARQHQMQIGALQTNRALRIANAALPYFRQGLTPVSAQRVAETIQEMTHTVAVAITNRQIVLAHVGQGADHHSSGNPLMTKATCQALAEGKTMIARSPAEIGCQQSSCTLQAVIVVPLLCREEVVGALKLYYAREQAITAVESEFAQGLGQIFSTQLELANLQRMAELAAKAELKALQAQINPHFLFNALNTIVSLCRTNPEQARSLLVELSDFFRRSLRTERDFVSLQEELEHVDSYLALEKARFGQRLSIEVQVDSTVLNKPVPAFILQPLVENAVKHGLVSQKNGGTIWLQAEPLNGCMQLCIKDNGKGMEPDVLANALTIGFGSGAGVGLSNVNERLKAIYGPQYALQVASKVGQGTTITLHIPIA